MKHLLIGKGIYTPSIIDSETTILIEDDTIVDVGSESTDGYKIIDLREYTIIPGLVDIHIHGINGYDTMDADLQSIVEMSKHIAALGVTSFLATTVTAQFKRIEAALKNIKECLNRELSGARLLGSYVEGPYISEEYKGAHPSQFIREINIDELKRLVEDAGEALVVITIAPEKHDAINAIKYLTSKNIRVSLGHTNATLAQAKDAINAGASIVTHLYNGMRGLNHREPGIVGAALVDDRAKVELICDLIHLEPTILHITHKCKGNENVILISDCIIAAGLKDGQYRLGELDIFVESGISRLKGGTLAGSTLKLLDAVKNMSLHAKIPFEDALAMATINPAKAIGKDDLVGSLEKGKKADIVALNDLFEPIFVMVGGKIVVNKTK
jgi:N-acetylglucosamine-6-phosphate deacetylase